jgi:hypothetical protein
LLDQSFQLCDLLEVLDFLVGNLLVQVILLLLLTELISLLVLRVVVYWLGYMCADHEG